ncbi:DUF6520 family protein [Flagellimonas okinawensis]|uniref:DUF6520 family protein n=1 Tax=Flagellimonas okinawensis TaxID=3031324 RepID=A0ABT5XP25_9FLAO|nr:DUF6520 family protein [[Muricauda] okinawensis]MDF0707648.1 DUF6520 family protein [[Muricauda] okinawensis]
MKKHLLKIILPAFAIVMAAGLAFATEESNLPYVGYIATESGYAEIQTDCPNVGQNQCYEGLDPVFNDIGLTDPKLRN